MTITLRRRVRTLVCGALLCSGALATFAQTVRFDRIGTIPGAVDMVRAQGDAVYIVHGRTLSLFDISNPAAPKRGGVYEFPDKIWGVKVIGRLLYAAVDKYGLGIVDVSNAATPTLRGSFKTPGQAKSVALVGATALVADHMAGVNFIDVSDPAKPVSRGSFFLDGYARAVAATGSIAAAVDAPTGLYVFDLKEPRQTEPTSSVQSAERPGTIELTDHSGAGAQSLAVLVGSGALQIYDITNPAAPAKLTSFRLPSGRAQRVALKGRLAYVADAQEGLQVVDLSTPATPRVIASYKTPMPARDVTVTDSLVLVAVGQGGGAESPATKGEVLILRQSS